MPTALLSVYDKDGIVEFADNLVTMGWSILASGGTAKKLRAGDIPVRDVADIIGGGAILGHRVVTLSREIHAGLLAREGDKEELARQGIPWIDMVVVDMYPLKDTIEMPGVISEMVLESTDIGGPTLLRSAAKGKRIVISDAADRDVVLQWLRDGQPKREARLNGLAAKAEFTATRYCMESARFLSKGQYEGIFGQKVRDCCYGENRWQSPAELFGAGTDDPLALDQFSIIEGNSPSYTNWRDLNRLLQTMTHIAAVMEKNLGHVPHIAVGVKHGNTCGAAIGEDPLMTTRKMVLGDPMSLFGGMVMTNFRVTRDAAERLRTAGLQEGAGRILDGVAAPSFDDNAVEMLKRKGGRCRLYQNYALGDIDASSLDKDPLIVPIRGGFLRQPNYTFVLDEQNEHLVKHGPAVLNKEDLFLAWAVGSTSNSNTVTLARNGMIIGNGVGQQNRVRCCKLAIQNAREADHNTRGASAYSDSFFPFTDGPEVLLGAGVTAVLTTSGSIKDDDVRQVFTERDIALWMIPDALGRGFFGH